MSAKNFFTKEQQEQIVNAIKTAELNTSGEVRVHVEETCDGEVLDRAAFVFSKLNTEKFFKSSAFFETTSFLALGFGSTLPSVSSSASSVRTIPASAKIFS